MLLIQQLSCQIIEISKQISNIYQNIKNLILCSEQTKNILCNHASAMIAVQSDIAALKVGLEDIVIPDPVDVNPIQQSMTVIPYDSSSQTVLLPLNVRIVSILVVNLSMTPTEELGYSCHTITSNVTNTIANVQFIGIHSSDPFQLEINYINITP